MRHRKKLSFSGSCASKTDAGPMRYITTANCRIYETLFISVPSKIGKRSDDPKIDKSLRRIVIGPLLFRRSLICCFIMLVILLRRTNRPRFLRRDKRDRHPNDQGRESWNQKHRIESVV